MYYLLTEILVIRHKSNFFKVFQYRYKYPEGYADDISGVGQACKLLAFKKKSIEYKTCQSSTFVSSKTGVSKGRSFPLTPLLFNYLHYSVMFIVLKSKN